MNRLQSELHRLYLALPRTPTQADAPSSRAMVMELTRPPSWEVLSRVWRGVQAELELPAPAIAVSGIDGLQLWFSVAQPIPVAQAHAFLEGLRSRFLPDVEPQRLRLSPAPHASAPDRERYALPVPALREETGNWSAFVAADLAPIFADTPWLDIPPNDEGQATLLRGLETMKQTVFEAALQKLAPMPRRPGESHGPEQPQDPRRFLLRIMNDETVGLALRIEAAKALLQHSNDHRPPVGG